MKSTRKHNKPNKQNKSNKKKKQNKTNKRIKVGGEILGQGGFGCVFYPALNCSNDSTNYTNDTKIVSKLLNRNKAEVENEILFKVEKIINDINKKQPSLNILNHFLVNGFKLCIPDKLYGNNKDDVNNCKSLTINDQFNQKIKIKSNNVNKYLNYLRVIQLPKGNFNIRQIINNSLYSFNVINQGLLKLLKNGILPINKNDLYNFDIKDTNILFNGYNAQLIDWGVSGIIKNKNVIPNIILSRGFNYNLPFSFILLLSGGHNEIIFQKKSDIPIIIGTYYLSYFSNHNKNINLIFKDDKNNPTIPGDIYTLVIEYCSKIVADRKFHKKSGNFFIFEREKYFRDVFLKNVDIYGFIISYEHFLKSNLLNKTNSNHLKKIITKYCFSDSYANIPIPINNLIKDLQNIKQ